MSVAGACPADDPADNIIIDQEINGASMIASIADSFCGFSLFLPE